MVIGNRQPVISRYPPSATIGSARTSPSQRVAEAITQPKAPRSVAPYSQVPSALRPVAENFAPGRSLPIKRAVRAGPLRKFKFMVDATTHANASDGTGVSCIAVVGVAAGGTGSAVAVMVAVGCMTGVAVAVGGTSVAVAIAVAVGAGVSVAVAVAVTVSAGVSVAVAVAIAVGAGVSVTVAETVAVVIAATLTAVAVAVPAVGVVGIARSAVGCGVSRMSGSVGRKSSNGAVQPSALDGIQPKVISRFQARIHRLSAVRP